MPDHFVRESLRLNRFWLRIMKEHAINTLTNRRPRYTGSTTRFRNNYGCSLKKAQRTFLKPAIPIKATRE
ncbi:MAG: DUF2935 domain-containing protein [Peptococcaceae bacterium]|nr:DUF2935 domain-containing protein [Peptococcaceae bacterium]